MIRLLGFLVGSAVSIGVFLLILGVPDINLKEQVINDDNIESVSRIVEDVTEDLEAIASDVIDEIAEYVPEQLTEIIDEAAAIEAINEPPPPEVVNTAPDPVPREFNPEQTENIPKDIAISNDLKWHAFWNPFRSRIAAEGFVGQLEKVTGLDYRVVKINTGVYEVTFGYENDDERREKMSLIASAAGLDLPDS